MRKNLAGSGDEIDGVNGVLISMFPMTPYGFHMENELPMNPNLALCG